MVRPRSVAIIGASAKRITQGNVVIANLKDWGFKGAIHPIHPQAKEIDGLAAVQSVAELPRDTDLAIVAIPAAQVKPLLDELEDNRVRSAIVFSNGFSRDDERAIRDLSSRSRLIVHGPNCMGLVNFTDAIPLYPSRPSKRLRAGKVALIAQSGSAAISIMNSTVVGLSKVVTVGSEFHVSAADYIRWLADDDSTRAIGVVAESIKDPVAFAVAAEAVHAAGKSLVVLKVGRSTVGMAATQAHTGALVSDVDAYDDYFSSTNIVTARDYDELVAALECATMTRRMVGGTGIGIVGISGGQTALACDIAETSGIQIASFGEATRQRVRQALPGSSGANPIDFGATVNVEDRKVPDAIAAVFADEDVGAVIAFQDTQESLNPATLDSYRSVLGVYAAAGASAEKPFVVISPTSENVDPSVRELLAKNGVPLIRGLTPGVRAVGSLRYGRPGPAGAWAGARSADRPPFHPQATEFRDEISRHSGALGPELAFRLLREYGLPVVKSCVVKDASEAVARAGEIGFPMAVKVASRDIQHRSDVGGVVVGVADFEGLRQAIARIAENVARGAPSAVIDGYELQEQVLDAVEAMAGFTTAEPFGPLVVVGSGGILVEVIADRAARLAPFDQTAALDMVSGTKLAKVLGGYRNLMPPTDLSQLADVAMRLSRMASDLRGAMVACDINPVLVSKGSGAVRIVDALCVCP